MDTSAVVHGALLAYSVTNRGTFCAKCGRNGFWSWVGGISGQIRGQKGGWIRPRMGCEISGILLCKTLFSVLSQEALHRVTQTSNSSIVGKDPRSPIELAGTVVWVRKKIYLTLRTLQMDPNQYHLSDSPLWDSKEERELPFKKAYVYTYQKCHRFRSEGVGYVERVKRNEIVLPFKGSSYCAFQGETSALFLHAIRLKNNLKMLSFKSI